MFLKARTLKCAITFFLKKKNIAKSDWPKSKEIGRSRIRPLCPSQGGTHRDMSERKERENRERENRERENRERENRERENRERERRDKQGREDKQGEKQQQEKQGEQKGEQKGEKEGGRALANFYFGQLQKNAEC